MSGALYISFFQGQLESVMERVVEFAVQEITSSVGESLTAFLVEIAAKEQENLRLRLGLGLGLAPGLQPCAAAVGGKTKSPGGTATSCPPKRASSPGHGSDAGREAHGERMQASRQTQKGRIVGQLQAVLDHVLKFAVTELTKIVEHSFDDLLTEMVAKEEENRILKLRLQLRRQEQQDNGVPENTGLKTAETLPKSPSNSSPGNNGDVQPHSQNAPDPAQSENSPTGQSNPPTDEKQSVLAVAQDWVPILDKVFGQKWCSDLWQIQELASADEEARVASLENFLRANPESPEEREGSQPEEPAPDRSFRPQWLQEERAEAYMLRRDQQGRPGSNTTNDSCGSSASPARTPSGAEPSRQTNGELQTSASDPEPLTGPSMLHRLLTLPTTGLTQSHPADAPHEDLERSPRPQPDCNQNFLKVETEEVGGELGEEPGPAASPCSPAVQRSYRCTQCGKRFRRLPLLRAHSDSHAQSPAPAAEGPFHCGSCGKSFLQSACLQSHQQVHTVGKKP
ncbi:uncharacterized protein LOC136767803 [Amia ocellicauda]|uniref:uncharacterized protein LOC136767803 n=1 Tax=Amia ocellicauda TaxID=2972642 RepID=UPI003464A691